MASKNKIDLPQLLSIGKNLNLIILMFWNTLPWRIAKEWVCFLFWSSWESFSEIFLSAPNAPKVYGFVYGRS